MNKIFCTNCKSDREIVNTDKNGAAIRHKLVCGHNSLELTLNETLPIIDELLGRKNGSSHEKIKQGVRPTNTNPNYAKKFIEYGDIDYEAAKVLFNIQNREYDFMNQAAFLSAQATEKYLKAYLFWQSFKTYPGLSGQQILYEFKILSHNLLKILERCQSQNTGFNNFRNEIKALNKFSLLKYPDIEDQMVYSDDGLLISSNLLKDVKQIGDFIKEIIASK